MVPIQTQEIHVSREQHFLPPIPSRPKAIHPFEVFIASLLKDKVTHLIVEKRKLENENQTLYSIDINNERVIYKETNTSYKTVWTCDLRNKTVLINDRLMEPTMLTEFTTKIKNIIKDLSMGRAEVTLMEEI